MQIAVCSFSRISWLKSKLQTANRKLQTKFVIFVLYVIFVLKTLLHTPSFNFSHFHNSTFSHFYNWKFMIILESERKSWKARIAIALVYSCLVLGAVTMVYPFAIMISSSLSSNYDYQRHDVAVKGFFSRSDRFMRLLALYFKSFPRGVFPEAPAGW